MSYILVTGGAGFLGANLCRHLIGTGHRVLCVDNLQTGRRENIEPLLGHPAFRFHIGDVRSIDRMIPLSVDPYELDQIYNLACPASPPHYQADPIGTMMTCVAGMNSVLDIAKNADISVVQASTSEVYGDPDVHPQHEEYRGNVNPIGPRSCYDEGKRAAEALLVDYRRVHRVKAKIVRIFNTYGPLMDPEDGRVVSNFIIQALKNEPITIYGDGLQTRSFCYVDDMVLGLVKMMNSRLSGPVNLGNPNEFTMHELAHMVCGMIGSTSRLVYEDLPEDDPKVRCPVISRARNFLDWEPKVELREGLEKTIEYFRGLV